MMMLPSKVLSSLSLLTYAVSVLFFFYTESSIAFSPIITTTPSSISKFGQSVVTSRKTITTTTTSLFASTEKVAREVNGEELEIMLTEWDEPLIVDAYATWCGPCLLMAPEFEAAAKELEGKVRFVKLDTDKEPEMAGRLNVMGLPTLLFLDKFQEPPKMNEDGTVDERSSTEEEQEDDGQAKAVLKDRVEGAIRKDSILALCNYHFFGGPRPEQL